MSYGEVLGSSVRPFTDMWGMNSLVDHQDRSHSFCPFLYPLDHLLLKVFGSRCFRNLVWWRMPLSSSINDFPTQKHHFILAGLIFSSLTLPAYSKPVCFFKFCALLAVTEVLENSHNLLKDRNSVKGSPKATPSPRAMVPSLGFLCLYRCAPTWSGKLHRYGNH